MVLCIWQKDQNLASLRCRNFRERELNVDHDTVRQAKQRIVNIYKMSFETAVCNQSIFDAVESLIYEVGRIFLPRNMKITQLDNCYFTKNPEEGTQGHRTRRQVFGVEHGEQILGICIVQRKEDVSLEARKHKSLVNDYRRNILNFSIDNEEILIQIRKVIHLTIIQPGKKRLKKVLAKQREGKPILWIHLLILRGII